MISAQQALIKYANKGTVKFTCGIFVDAKYITTAVYDLNKKDFVYHGRHKKNMQSSVVKAIAVLLVVSQFGFIGSVSV